ncbi:hypothetical protein RHSIM_Rhsim03G0245800 [Rhododendron simsii]|uniref:F-box domain-containing protein n=1 Tax=Rhododendron simsii TaxID=118357 RepID=A0A834H7S4_RHOSS|nr:hypothetical protein RHSIM_Rhsim03G0245800 [Rhododendron simsii]
MDIHDVLRVPTARYPPQRFALLQATIRSSDSSDDPNEDISALLAKYCTSSNPESEPQLKLLLPLIVSSFGGIKSVNETMQELKKLHLRTDAMGDVLKCLLSTKSSGKWQSGPRRPLQGLERLRLLARTESRALFCGVSPFIESYIGAQDRQPTPVKRSSCWWYLPEELLSEILSRLPVKSLTQCKCVCKRWCALVENPCFIAAHLNNSTTRMVSWNDNSNGLINGHNGFHLFPNCTNHLKPVDLNFGFDRKPDIIFGPCDGIFCLYWWSSNGRPYPLYVERLPTIALWNPATRGFRILPVSNFDHPPYRKAGRCTVGFGFDHKSRSYKVVKILGLWVRDTYHWVKCAEVYTLGSGSWRVICVDVVQNLKMDDGKISACTNNDGVFHWRWQDYDGNNVAVSFDMSTEVFCVTPLPKMYNTSLRDRADTWFDVWLMKDNEYNYDVKESSSTWWSHEFTVEPPPRGSCSSLGFWNESELFILQSKCHGPPFLYDPLTKQAREVPPITGKPNFIYAESLVSVKG